MSLIDTAVLLHAIFGVIGLIDAFYFHYHRHALHLNEESLDEHRLHTLLALTFVVTLPLLYLWNCGGALLWLGVLMFLAQTILFLVDMLKERASRRRWGGVGSIEYALHGLAWGFHFASFALAAAAKPRVAWSLSSPWLLDAHDLPARVGGGLLFAGAVPVALWQIHLTRAPKARGFTDETKKVSESA